jgi:low temperature requirement protein LtrA
MKIKGLRPPQLRTVMGEAHRTATWLELFYDLAFVVAVAVLGGRLAVATEWRGVASYTGYFVLLWWLWASHTFYADRYDTDDLAYRILATVQLVAVAFIAASISQGPAMSTLAFAVGYVLAKAALLAMYWRARTHVPETRTLVNGYLVGFTLAAALWFVSIFVPEPGRFVLWAVALAIDLATPYIMRKEQARVPLDVSHLPERFGLFTILVLGESIAATVVGLSGHEWDGASTATAVLAMVLITAVWWLYFDNVEGLVVRRDPTRERNWRPTVWIYSHFGLAAGLGVVAVGLEHSISEAGHELSSFHRWLLVGGVAVVVTFLGLTHLASGDETSYQAHNRVARTRFVSAAGILVLGLLSFMGSTATVLAITIILVGTTIYSVPD